jgi:hypothetical protein
MHFAYVDDSGNSGLPARGGSQTYTLACVLVEARRWPDVFDDLIDFRRFLKARFGIPVRTEIKANYLLHNRGPHFRPNPMSERARFAVYRGFMRLQPKLGIQAFAVVIRKAGLALKGITVDPREIAWEYLLQRLERFSTKGGIPVLIMHDEGEALMIRKLARKARRAGTAGSAFGTGTLKRPARLILDDPVPRHSNQSYFIQLADLNAYAAFRHFFPPPPRPVHVVPQSMWSELGAARYKPVSHLAGGPDGLVVWP